MACSEVFTPKSIELAKIGAMLSGEDESGDDEGATYLACECLPILLAA